MYILRKGRGPHDTKQRAKHMTKYVVKLTQVNIETMEQHNFYLGKDGYVHDEAQDADGYKVKRFAEDYIKRDIKGPFKKVIDERHAIEHGKWLSIYDIVEVEQPND